ncbi:MarR family winged helix-turn-helix transcriptional regulator [Candidatus Enterococcus ikei]|uniref:MarR family transcriptional regulator n=1 Tax=Candidatus Enterococcus ikei TaxID=2815326 RepID=A0ABS3H407_9ENTE|nr:MarR family transcriptional regulator [Enterococcus sp. DIV0869a]MBO0441944.1 MarR family transcriptional regulator [Enterococcus sp. DIV0869a]
MSNNQTNSNSSPAAQQLTSLLRGFGSRSILHQQAIVHSLGISPNDFISIDLLNELGPLTAGELAEHTGLSTGTITALIDRLEKNGYARREKDPNDRRRVIIVPTYEDKEEIQKAYMPLDSAMNALAQEYSEKELENINHFLEKAVLVLDEQLQNK